MKFFFHLSTCSTCQRIIKELPLAGSDVVMQDIKTEAITPEQLDRMGALAGSFEALFSRKAMKYRSMGLNEKELSEQEYRNLILQEYTFLKRPVLLAGDAIAIGNAKAAVDEMQAILQR
jgi:arsenate reductase